MHLFIQSQLNHALVALQSGGPQDFDHEVKVLRRIYFMVNPDQIVHFYQNTTDPKQRERLSRAFEAISGESIEDRLAYLSD